MAEQQSIAIWPGSTFESIPMDSSHQPRTRYVGEHEGGFAAAILPPPDVVVSWPNPDVIVTGMSQRLAETVAVRIRRQFDDAGNIDVEGIISESVQQIDNKAVRNGGGLLKIGGITGSVPWDEVTNIGVAGDSYSHDVVCLLATSNRFIPLVRCETSEAAGKALASLVDARSAGRDFDIRRARSVHGRVLY